MEKGIIYFTDNRIDPKIDKRVRDTISRAGLPIVSASLEPIDFGKNIHVPMKRGYQAMFTQILTALEHSEADIIFFCEHDVLYHKSHFDFTPPKKDVFYYNHNWWKIGKGDLAVHWDADQVSGMCAYKPILIEFYRERVKTFDPENFDRKFEPLSGHGSESWKSEFPLIDIRHGKNLTYDKWSLDHFRNKDSAVNFEQTTIDKIPGWENLAIIS